MRGRVSPTHHPSFFFFPPAWETLRRGAQTYPIQPRVPTTHTRPTLTPPILSVPLSPPGTSSPAHILPSSHSAAALARQVKSMVINSYVRDQDRVLDFACGKGGDLTKYKKANVGTYVGVDIALESVR